jgi:hypothetical protein
MGDTLEYVLRYFGEPSDGQGRFQASLSEHLFLNNASHLRQKIQRSKGNLIDQLATSKDPVEAKVDKLFLAVLTRKPKPAEKDAFIKHLKAEGPMTKIDTLLEEAIWALLNTSEFRFNR